MMPWRKPALAVLMPVALLLSSLSAFAQGKRPEATFYCTDAAQVGLDMIFDLDDAGRLCDKPSRTVVLGTPSESENPWTFFLEGGFYLALDGQDSMKYGSYYFAKVASGSAERTIGVFRRTGDGERSLGNPAGEGAIFSVGADGKSVQVGERRFMDVTTPDGGARTITACRFVDPATPWAAALGDKVYSIDGKKAMTQKGWIGWRRIVAPDGRKLVILMTKGMDAKARWAGRFDGVLYEDK
jgi:hypothetical protein